LLAAAGAHGFHIKWDSLYEEIEEMALGRELRKTTTTRKRWHVMLASGAIKLQNA
jgi:hypothetical protein